MSENVIPWQATSPDFDDLWAQGDDSPDEAPDILVTMFAQQEQHMQAYDRIQGRPTVTADNAERGIADRRVQASIREFASYTVEEMYEAINHLKNKPWKQTERPVDPEEFRKEIGDMWHFFIEMHIIAGITAEDVFMAYFQASDINVYRQNNGY